MVCIAHMQHLENYENYSEHYDRMTVLSLPER